VTRRDAALGYTARGWHVLPLCWPAADGTCGCGRAHEGRDIGKAPLLGAGWQHVRADAAQVRAWWRCWPHANVGVLLEPARLLVVDLDGPEAVAEADTLGCPPTYTVRRGTHLHLYYARPADVPAGRRTHRGACRAIDVLAAGYVVAAGSLHGSGDRYEVAEDAPIAQAPVWAADLLRPAPAAPAREVILPATPLRLSRRMERVLRDGPDGDPGRYASRSEAVAAVVTAMVRAGYTDAAIVDTLAAQAWTKDMRGHLDTWLARDVERARARGMTPRVQGWDYAALAGEARG
jgi:hypothetical protein